VAAAPAVREHASFPLMPFSNRIGAGRFSFAGTHYELPRDTHDPRHALHGNALYAAWGVQRTGPAAARLMLDYCPGQGDVPFFPFAYRATQHYRLLPDALCIGMRLRNTDARPFPAGFGHHLYFPRHNGAVLRFLAAGHWRNGPDGLPAAASTALREGFAAGEVIGTRALDNCFFGWDGLAEIAYPQMGYALRLTATPALRHAVLFVPQAQNAFAFEPVSHATDAVNRPHTGGMRILTPGETMTATIRLRFCKSSARERPVPRPQQQHTHSD
jgi:aldose 1-epimerase